MPTFEYVCKEHGPFDEIRPIRKRKRAKCPKCGRWCRYNPVASNPSTTALSEGAREELMEVLQHAVPPGERVPDIRTHGQVKEFLVHHGFHPDGIIHTTELARRMGIPRYDHMERDREKKGVRDGKHFRIGYVTG